MSRFHRFILIILILAFVAPIALAIRSALPAKAAFNAVINYQGKLTNGSYVAVPDGTYNMEFKLYDAPSSGSLLWTETRTGGNKVQVTSGVFSVMLGDVNGFGSLDFNQTLYLTVNIGGTGSPSWDGEMSPRKKIGAVPAAFIASNLRGTGTIDITSTSAPQETLNYDGSNKLTVGVASTGFTTLTAVGTGAGFNLTGGNVGIGTSTVSAKLHVTATSEQLRTSYDASNYTSFTTSSGGDLTIAPSGSDLAVTGNVDVSGTLTAGTADAFQVNSSGVITSGGYQGTIITSAYGGTGNGFTKFSGPASTEKTFTLPNASATILTTNSAVTPAQGGTGTGTYALGDMLYSDATNSLAKLSGNITTTRKFLRQTGNGSISAAPAWDTLTSADVGLGNVENTALSTWAGSTNITTVGTIATGTWSGTTIAVNKGGTGTTDGSITGTGALGFTAGGSGNSITLTGTTTGVVKVASTTANTDTINLKPQTAGTGATFAGIITTADITTADKTYTFPDASITVNAAADISGTTLASNVVSSSLTGTGTLTAGATGSGFTVALGTSTITGILGATNGGTGNGFTAFSGPTTSTKTFTLPDSSATLLYSGGALGTPSSGVATNLTGTASGLTAGNATTLATARNLWGQSFNGSADVTGSLTSVGNITGGASSMTILAGTGASRTLTFQTTTAGSAATTALTLAADQSATFANTVNATTFVEGGTSLVAKYAPINANFITVTANGTLTGETGIDALTTAISTTNNISTTGSGTITSAGLLTASGGLTLAANQNFTMTAGTGLFVQNHTVATDATADAMTLNLSPGGTGSTNVLRGLVINQADTATTGVYDSLAYILNQKTPETTTNGLFIENNAASGILSNGINITNTAGTLTNGISFTGTMTAALKFNAASDIDILDNSSTGLTITEGSNQYLLVNTDNTNTVVTLDTPVAGATTTTLNLGTAALAKTINIGSTSDSALKLKKFATANGLLYISATDGTVSETSVNAGATQCLTQASSGTPTWGSCGAGGATAWDLIGDPSGNGAVAMGTTVQTLDWTTITTTDALTVTNSGTGLTSGSAFKVTSATTGAVTNGIVQLLASANYSGTGGLLNVTANSTTGGTVARISGTGLTTGTGLTIQGGTAMTTGGDIDINGATYNHTGSETGSLAKIMFTESTSNAVTSTTNGLLISPTITMIGGAATRTINGISVEPTFTSCPAGTCTVNGLNVGNVTDGTGFTGTGLKVGTGWDAGFTIASGNNSIQANSLNAFQIATNSGLVIENVNTAFGAGFANLIYNPSFEQNIHNWVAKGTPTGSTPVWDNTASNAKYGSGTLKFSGDAAGDGAQFSFPFKPSQAYSVSFWVKASAAGPFTIRVDRQDNGSDVGGCADNATISTTWQQITCTFTTGATINTSTSNIFVKQNAAGTPTFFIDGFEMTEGSTALSYSVPGNNIEVDADYSSIILNAGQDADVQPWQLNSTSLPSGRRAASSITANGFYYYIGGNPNGAPSNVVNYARINADGSLTAGSWSAANTLPVALYGHSSISANGYVYVIGGCSDSSATAACTTPVATVYYAKLNSDGTVGTWQTNANALPAARGFGSMVFANGYVYYLGGYNASAQTAVYSGRLNADGSISGWTTTGVTALGSGRYGETSMNVNGKIYSIGGCSDAGALCNTAITTVEYATPANDGTLGAWTAATSLPTATGFHTTGIMNGYLFNMGGRQASAAVATVYYAKVNSVGPLGVWTTSSNPLPAARQQATSLYVNTYLYNLGGYDGTTLATSAFFGSGARVSIFGGLDLLGLTSQTLTDYSGGGTLTAGNTRVVGDLRVDGFADLNNGLTVDSVINLNAVSAVAGQSVFNINNLNSNSIFSVRHMNSNFGSLATAGAFMSNMSYFGDEFSIHNRNTALTADTAGGVGDTQEMYFDTFTGTATTYATIANSINGVGRVSYPATSGTGSVIANGKITAATMDTPFQSANLPVVQMKVKPSANTATNDMIYGLTGTYAASGTNDTLPANGIYFWNNNAAGGWQGVVRSGSSNIGTVTCSGAISTAQFATLRIEVLVGTGSSGQVHFMVDNDASDGTNFIDCGTVTGTLPAGPFAATISNIHTVAATATVDIDYIRIWQDDSGITPEENTPDETTVQPPLTIEDAPTEFNAKSFLADLMTQTDADTAEVNAQAVAVKQDEFDRLVAKTEIVTPKITASGLVIDSISALDHNISFMSDTSFIGRPYFNNDTAGFAQFKEGDRKVRIDFETEYLTQPIVNVGIALNADAAYGNTTDPSTIERLEADQEAAAQTLFDSGIQYVVINKNEKGFTILLNKAAPRDMMFSWIALAVKDAKISLVRGTAETDSGTVAGDSTNNSSSTDGQGSGSNSSGEETTAPPSSDTEQSSPPDENSPSPPADPPADSPPPSDGG